MENRIVAHLPQAAGHQVSELAGSALPEALRAGFSAARADSVLAPAAVILLGAVASLFFQPANAPTRR
ncbi:MAG: hypothetical protein IPI13_08315 [Actinomycetales bacterium]|jgi:hypothetical protein|uniref:Uncharacterized protein n=1 Tax=Candidatus Phosphoribacter hodrii TaxID=2953743 RepID=A0A935IJC8_9MICO|nr:hypothetical protein [Candidatus Phosphoribacter hodrii]